MNSTQFYTVKKEHLKYLKSCEHSFWVIIQYSGNKRYLAAVSSELPDANKYLLKISLEGFPKIPATQGPYQHCLKHENRR